MTGSDSETALVGAKPTVLARAVLRSDAVAGTGLGDEARGREADGAVEVEAIGGVAVVEVVVTVVFVGVGAIIGADGAEADKDAMDAATDLRLEDAVIGIDVDRNSL